MKVQSTTVKEDMQGRLRRIEGQVRGIERMLVEERECHEVVQQLKAVQSALKNATAVFMQGYARECLLNTDTIDPAAREALVDDLLSLMAKVDI